uniref:7TM_GPCR_Srx domain-containing protein n=2 Tax=Bursaphelenchus xylophilus TaxID=6326 RepID=A0A1I7SHD7_BURXY
VVEVKGGVSFFITLGPFEHTGYPYNFLMASLFLGALYTTVFTLGMQFVYRYFALCRNPLTVAEFAGMYFSGVFSMFAIALLSFFAFRDMSEEDTELLKGHPAYTYDTPIYMAVDPGSVHSRLHIAFSQSTVICVYAVIIYTGRKINAKLRDVSTDMSESTRAAHKQLNKVMIIQASYPAVVLGLPILVATLCIQLRVDVLWAGLYLVPSASLIPMANAITVMLVIPSFRNRLLGKLQKSGKIKGVSGSKAFSTELKPNMSSML